MPNRDQRPPGSLFQELDEGSTLDEGIDDGLDGESTQSLSSSVLDYTYENGRRYHAFRAGQYIMPNDEREQEGMDLMHHMSSLLLRGELYCAPVSSPTSILDIGTGTGIWAIDVADLFPAASVIATDLSPIQPGWVPPNLEFQVDDCESEWNFGRKFDFIHTRNLAGAISDWPRLLENCYNHLKPGGWIEVSTMEAWMYSNNDSLADTGPTLTWQTNLAHAAKSFGREINIGPKLGNLFADAGLVNVKHDRYRVPVSSWMRDRQDLGKCFQELTDIELEAVSLRLFTGVLGWSAEDVRALVADTHAEMCDPANEVYGLMHYVYGRRPEV